LKVLVVGNGGREHAICWKLSSSPLVSKVFCYPGNAGTGQVAENILPTTPLTVQGIADFAENQQIDLTVVGPEAFLAQGIVDEFHKHGLAIYGPTKYAAQLEASKVYAKDFMKKYNIPTAQYRTFSDPILAKDYIGTTGVPLVIKADGLAAGKGVVVAFDQETALKAIDEAMTQKVFGDAGAAVVIEEYLEGEEVSLLAFCDGKVAVPMLPVQDHKRIGDGDTGPNTGGMGAYTPTTVYTEEIAAKVQQEILDPTIRAMAVEGVPYVGTLFLGLMITAQGPKLIEYNVRFGDPETQAVLPLLDSDLAEIFQSATRGRLKPESICWKSGVTSVCVVAASGGYPGKYRDGKVITGSVTNSLIFHAGTKVNKQGQLVTAGGRVINLVHLAANIDEAITGVYQDMEKIHFEGICYRNDIGRRELNRSHQF
jgi:phosphoribosylamine--glycine ligase